MHNRPIIELRNVTFQYPSRETPVFENITITIKKGECVLICGKSGCGKSTILNLINGIIPHILSGVLTGHVAVDGIFPEDVPLPILSQKVGSVFQNPDHQLFMATVHEDVAFGCENLRMSKDEILINVKNVLEQIGIWSIRDQTIHTLSGGQKQRTAIAGVTAMNCEILLMDEPTSDLDPEGRKECIDIIQKLKQTNHTVVIATHLYEDFIGVADSIYHFDDRILEKGLPDIIYPTVQRLEKKHNPKNDIIVFDNVTIEYNSHAVLTNINLQVKEGECVAIAGPNGSGKTTLLNAICGLLKPAIGSICTCGMTNPTLKNLIGKIGYLFQNPDEQLFEVSVEQEILFGPRCLQRQVNFEDYLKSMDLFQYRNQHPHLLSRGERQRLVFASFLAIEPRIFLLDEPTSGLDEHNWTHLMELAKHLTYNGTCIIFSSHNEKVINNYADRVIYLDQGRLTYDKLYS